MSARAGKVLIVEDDRDTASLICEELIERGFHRAAGELRAACQTSLQELRRYFSTADADDNM